MFGGGTDDAASQPADNNQPMAQDAGNGAYDAGGMPPAHDPNALSQYDDGSQGDHNNQGNDDNGMTDQAPSEPAEDGAHHEDTPADDSMATHGDTDDLLEIKQQALQQLSPLVGHLDQSPEDKFRTTMMMIQASDNPALVKDAYAAAGQITDEKARAQALLDIVNEINYFTQHHDGQQ